MSSYQKVKNDLVEVIMREYGFHLLEGIDFSIDGEKKLIIHSIFLDENDIFNLSEASNNLDFKELEQEIYNEVREDYNGYLFYKNSSDKLNNNFSFKIEGLSDNKYTEKLESFISEEIKQMLLKINK